MSSWFLGMLRINILLSIQVRNAFRRQREKNALSKENDSQYQPTFSVSVSVHIKSQK